MMSLMLYPLMFALNDGIEPIAQRVVSCVIICATTTLVAAQDGPAPMSANVTRVEHSTLRWAS